MITREPAWTSDDVRSFRATAREFIQREFVPHQARWRQQHRPDPEAWTAAGTAGLLLPDVPEQYGGGGGTFAHEAVVLEELARAGVDFAFSIQSVVAHYVLAHGTEHQKQTWLPRGRNSHRRDRDERAWRWVGSPGHQNERTTRSGRLRH